MADIAYQRLTRSRSRFLFAPAFGLIFILFSPRVSVWLGTDHLLVVDTIGYTESYKRFYFRDIQALTIQRSSIFLVINVVLGVLFTLMMAAALTTSEAVGKIILFSAAGLWGVLALVNILLGPTCRCYLRTAVQEEHLPPLCRVRKVEKIFARLRPFIASAQGGELSSAALAGRIRERDLAASALAAEASPAPADNPLTLDP